MNGFNRRFCTAGVAAFLASIAAFGAVAAQEQPLHVSPAVSPDIAARQRLQAPRTPPAPPTTDAQLQKIGLTRTAIEQRKAAPVKAPVLPIATRAPAKQPVATPSGLPRSPTLPELIAIIRKQPGGADVLARAQRAGAHIPAAGGAGIESGARTSVAPGGPRETENASAAPALMDQTARATRNAPTGTLPGIVTVTAEDNYPTSSNTYATWGPLIRQSVTTSTNTPVGPFDVKPYMTISLQVTSPGYYVINVVSYPTVADLKLFSPTGYSVLGTIDNSNESLYTSYPVVVNLAAGNYYMAWVPSTSVMGVSEVSITKL